jgi:hypothetical protein
VRYEKANAPQAWASAVPIFRATQLFAGLAPDVPNRRICLDPWLPDWLPWLELEGVPVGDGFIKTPARCAGLQFRSARQTRRLRSGVPPKERRIEHVIGKGTRLAIGDRPRVLASRSTATHLLAATQVFRPALRRRQAELVRRGDSWVAIA